MSALLLAWVAPSGQLSRPVDIKTLYVEPFTTTSAQNTLRADLISELRKLKTITLTGDESQADAILGGGGEVWVAGYRSLNPRSGRWPEDGAPVYGGYLAVELRDRQGVTLWSDLVTPGEASADVSKELAKTIVRHAALALSHAEEQQISPSDTLPAVTLRGGGATFPFPVYEKWFANYRRSNPRVALTYEALGSETGVKRLLAGELDFAASDSPRAIQDLAPSKEEDYVFVPSVVGAVVPIVNLPGIAGDIQFTPGILAGIYLGKITRWNDPALRAVNRALKLPDLEIKVVHRSDGSGTSYALTDYLARNSAEWKQQAGQGFDPHWPVGSGAAGNEGVAEMVKEIGGSVGYVEFIYALRNHLHYGRVQNRLGQFVGASLESISAAVNSATAISDDLKVSIVNAPGSGAYPIASFTWFVFPAHFSDAGKRSALMAFFRWALGPGQTQAAALGYLQLPADVVRRARAKLE